MMSEKKIFGSIIFFTGIFIFYGCKKFVEIQPPSTQIVSESVFSNDNAATAALTAIYSQMKIESWNMAQSTGLLSDELTSYSTYPSIPPYYQDALMAITDPVPGPWFNAYNYIYQANAIITGVKNSNSISPAIMKQLIGEAEFLRAFWYFYLVNCYGDVPLVITTDYKINAALERAPQEQVYKQMVNDLKDAQSILNYDYVADNDTSLTAERIRPNKATATALLARVYLYMKDYIDAENQATTILNDTRYRLCTNLDSVFLMNSSETIWQIAIPFPSTYNTVDAFNFILLAAPDPGSDIRTATINPILQNSFEIGDKRKESWIGYIKTTNPDSIYYFPYKYKNYTLPITEYTMMFRLAEQYFIRAEALIQQNKNLTQAVKDINAIRDRANLVDYKGSNPDSLLNIILHERQVELFSEWGHRWFDLKRTGNIDVVMDSVAPKKNGFWKPYKSFFPIPQIEITIDFNLTQNIGY